jgi:hypothetical protein
MLCNHTQRVYMTWFTPRTRLIGVQVPCDSRKGFDLAVSTLFHFADFEIEGKPSFYFFGKAKRTIVSLTYLPLMFHFEL